jgi:hypothetical protein
MRRSAEPSPLTRRQRLRPIAGRVTTILAFLLVWLALVVPDQLGRITLWTLIRIPVEGLIVVALGLVLPGRPRRIVAAGVGFVLGLLVIVKVLDTGFVAALDRPFDPVTDWGYLGPAYGVLRDSVGSGWAAATAVGAALLVLALLVVIPLSVVRVTAVAAGHRTMSARTITAMATIWIVCSAIGVRVDGAEPVASSSAAGLAVTQVRDVHAAIEDQHKFAAALTGVDPLRATPAQDLLSGLRGKDVIIAFVESYGQVAVQGSGFSPQVDDVLNAGTSALHAAGYSARSAFLTSPTFGGISWLAHSTLQSGLWVDNQQRYNQLVASNRFTLSDAFRNAGWRTVGDVPSNGSNWTEGTSFYHYEQLYDSGNVGYHGPRFSYATMPDQYILSAFQRLELAKPNRAPVMAEIDLVSSHTPWAPLPQLVPWDRLGDGSIFDPMPAEGHSPNAVWSSSAQVRAAYGQSIQYSLNSLVSFVQNAHDNNLVLVVLGDHQPATIVSGANATHNVPISIIAHDPAVLDRISSWGWQDGLLPSPDAPVWRMDSFRDRFLRAYQTSLGPISAAPH